MSLRCCACWAEKLPDNVTCGKGCEVFPCCLPQLELVRTLTERRQAGGSSEPGGRPATPPGTAGGTKRPAG